MAKSKKSLIFTILVIALGVLAILPLFLNFFGLKVSLSYGGITHEASYSIPLFLKATVKSGSFSDKGAVMDLFKYEFLNSKPLFIIIQIVAVLGAIAGLVAAVFAVLNLCGVKVAIIDKINKYLSLALIGIAALIFVLGLIFVIANLIDLKEDYTKILFFGIEGWLLAILTTGGCGVLAFLNK